MSLGRFRLCTALLTSKNVFSRLPCRRFEYITFQCRNKSSLWCGIWLSSCHLIPFLIPPLVPISCLELSLRLLLPRFPPPLQNSLWRFRPHRSPFVSLRFSL